MPDLNRSFYSRVGRAVGKAKNDLPVVGDLLITPINNVNVSRVGVSHVAGAAGTIDGEAGSNNRSWG